MPFWFYSPELAAPGPIELSESEAHHLAHVLRLSSGDAIEIFNGRGGVGDAVVGRIGKRTTVCEVRSFRQEPVPSPELTLGTAVPKGDRFDWLVEKATELGVSRLVPLSAARSTVDPRDTKLARLRQTIIAACKQSRRSHLMELTAVWNWSQFVERARGGLLLVAQPGSDVISTIDGNSCDNDTKIAMAVGPEGGWTDEELSLALQNGGRLVGLGPNILRIETAGLLLACWGSVRQHSSEKV